MYDQQQSPAQAPQKPVGAPPETEACVDPLGMWSDLGGNSFMQEALATGTMGALDGGEEMCAPEVVEEATPEVQETVAEDAEQCLDGEAPSPEERVAAAEVAREGLQAQLDGMDHLSPERRALVMQRVAGLEGEALAREMETISHALQGPNADRALGAYAEVQQMIAEDPERAARLNPEIVDMLVRGVSDRRTDSDRGQTGVMGVGNVRDAARGLLEMDEDQYAETVDLLHQAGTDADGNAVAGADASTEQALLLKAVGARRERLDRGFWGGIAHAVGFETDSDRAMGDLRSFAGDIRGMERAELVRNTTLQDIDDVNTSDLNTVDNDSLNAHNDTRVNNDGLFQRMNDSCAPTSSQMVRGEADPIYAMRLRQNNFQDPNIGGDIGDEQQGVMDRHGGDSRYRQGDEANTAYNTTANTLEAAGTITSDQRTALDKRLSGQPLDETEQAHADVALEAVRAANGGHPTDRELEAIQYGQGHGATGVWFDEALNDVASGSTHRDYKYRWYDQAAGESVSQELGDIDQRLMDGEPVAFQIDWAGGGAHAMSVTDVRFNPDGTRQYLVYDPWRGDTNWVSQDDFQNGRLPLGSGRISGIINSTERP